MSWWDRWMWLCGPRLRLIPRLGPIREQAGRVVPTPHRKGKLKGVPQMASFTMSDSQQCTLTISAVDKKGNPATLPAGSVQFLVDNPALLALTPAADGQSCLCAAVGPLGTATVSVKVVDGSGNTLAAGSIDCTISGGAASVIQIAASAPVEQP